MQINDTTTDTTTDTAPTLADLLTQRATQLDEERAESERRRISLRELDRRESIERIAEWAREHISPELGVALAIAADCDESELDALEEDYPAILPGHMLFTIEGERWRIRQNWRRDATLIGPNGYAAIITPSYRGDPLDARILDAIAAYPAWLARAYERRAAEEEKRRAEEERREREKPRHCFYTQGLTPDDVRPGVLASGNRMLVRVLDPSQEGGIMTWRGMLQSHDALWLLLNIDGAGPGVGAQRLIPIARVEEVLLLPERTSLAAE